MVSGQGPVWAPRLRLPPAKIGKHKSGIILGPVLDPCSKEPRQTTSGASLTELRKFNFIIYKHIPIY
jgi:hypothetical protein